MCADAPDQSGVNEAARASAKLGQEAFDWFKKEYTATAGQRQATQDRANAVSDAQLASMNYALDQAKDAWVSVDLTWNNGALSAGSTSAPASISDYPLDQQKWDVLMNGRTLIRAAHIQSLSAGLISTGINGGAADGIQVAGNKLSVYTDLGAAIIDLGKLS